LFFYLSDGSGSSLAFGSVFTLAGALVLAASRKWFRRIKNDNGELLKNELVRFFVESEVRMFSKVVFDYAKNTEKFEP
jgi:hypothetical protein